MSRTTYAHDSSEDNFAGLLDRLTQRAAGAATARATTARYDPEFDSVRVSAAGMDAVAAAERRARTLAPIAAAKPRSGRLASEATTLSYEKALRLHSRHSAAADLKLPLTKTAGPMRPNPAQSNPVHPSPAATERVATRSADSTRQDTGKASGRKRGGASSPNAARTTKRAAEERISARPTATTGRPGQASAETTIEAALKAAASAAARMQSDTSSTGRTRNARNKASQPETRATAETPRSRKTSFDAEPESRHRPAAARADQGKQGAVAKPQVGREKKQRESLQLEVARNPGLEQRHAIVSIRLKDAEFDRLRIRAAESGISVSAYMRSCVLDAEHLRSQVKQALAEMRASMQPTGLTALPALAAGDGSGSAMGGSSWSRLLWRSATLLLGPLLAFRHRG